MKIICKKTTSKGFDLNEVTTVLSQNFDYTFGGSGLEMGKEYLVMGIAVYKDSNCVYFLVDTAGRPNWFSHLLFEVLDNSVPANWFVRVNGKRADSDVYSHVGFDELCNNEMYYDQLVNRDEEAIRIYFERKSELVLFGMK